VDYENISIRYTCVTVHRRRNSYYSATIQGVCENVVILGVGVHIMRPQVDNIRPYKRYIAISA